MYTVKYYNKKFRLLLLFGVISIIFLLIFVYNNQRYQSEAELDLNLIISKDIENLGNKLNKNVTNILFWIKYWNDPSWYLGSDEAGEEMLKSVGCPITNCFFTHNKEYLPKVTDFDAILFHGAEYMSVPVPNERSQHQSYVYTILESPYLSFENLDRFRNFFNLTMTYRFDSDIQWHYGSIYDNETKNLIAPSTNPNWKEPEKGFYDAVLFEIFKNKKKKIAWFSSNCKPNSRRTELVNEIKKYMEVDIYGKCGNFSCPMKSKKCDHLLSTDYMFYLSFENALCKDYVTEKLYRPFSEFIIPVAFNGVNISLYAPPKSYIDANNFDNVKNLTDYLKFLMDDPKAYLEYFWWKKHYYVIYNEPIFKYGFCELCMKIRNNEYHKEKHLYPDIKNWWMNGTCTKESRIKF